MSMHNKHRQRTLHSEEPFERPLLPGNSILRQTEPGSRRFKRCASLGSGRAVLVPEIHAIHSSSSIFITPLNAYPVSEQL